MSTYTPNEMMTIASARALRNEDVCFVGIGQPSAAANLARLTHAPDITLIYESGTLSTKPNVLPLSIGDPELCETALTTVSVPEMFRYWLQGGRITVGFLGGAQIDVSGEEEVRLGRQRVERLQRGRPHRCAAECGAESFDRRLTRPTEWEVCRPTTGGRAGTHPSAPSISSRISRLNSSAYSIGSSLVKTSRNPWTIRFVASFSVMPRLIR